MTKSDAGRWGGLATLARHGKEGMKERGALGGRPRNKTLSEIRHQRAQDADKKLKEVLGSKGYHRRANKKVGAVS